MKINGTQQLDEIGERAIIEHILKTRYGRKKSDRFGDDCAVVTMEILPSSTIIATTDPCPEPMAGFVGFDDPYYRGWLLAAINLSDIAASGAKPLGLLTSLILPNNTTVKQFTRLLDGIDDCCRQCGTQVIGGNLKEGDTVLSATAIGACPADELMSRSGCQPGDLIVVVGDLGLFWAGVLSHINSIETNEFKDKLFKNILTPVPKIAVGRAIAEKKLLTACMDNSDGLYPSLDQLSSINNLQMNLKMDTISYIPEVDFVSSKISIEPLRMALGWGDWQLIGCCSPDKLSELQNVAKLNSTDVFVIGNVEIGEGVILNYKDRSGLMAPIDSQRFTKDSWFTSGIDSYIKILTEGNLWV